MQFLDWQSDGFLAFLVLFLYGIVLLMTMLRLVRKNPVLRRLIVPAVCWHLAVMLFTAFWVLPHYAADSKADTYGYHYEGLRLAGLMRGGDWSEIPWGVSTAATQILTAFLYLPAGGDVYGMQFFSAVLGLCGSFYFCLAFAERAAPVQVKRYSKIILFLPSFGLWTGIFGKDSWIALGLGMAAFGYSSLLKGGGKGLWHLIGGITITTIIRPHISVAFIAAATASYIVGLTRNRRTSILLKMEIVVLLLVMFVGLASITQRFLKLEDVSVDTLAEYGEEHSAGNNTGGSAVDVHVGSGLTGVLLALPEGIIRILFQPFPWEVRNSTMGLAALENLYILWFMLGHMARLRSLFRRILKEPYALFSILFALALLLMLSLTPNLGLLSRQRVQLLPFVFAPLIAADFIRRRPSSLHSAPYYTLLPRADPEPVSPVQSSRP